jgi:hypothetical protein
LEVFSTELTLNIQRKEYFGSLQDKFSKKISLRCLKYVVFCRMLVVLSGTAEHRGMFRDCPVKSGTVGDYDTPLQWNLIKKFTLKTNNFCLAQTSFQALFGLL